MAAKKVGKVKTFADDFNFGANRSAQRSEISRRNWKKLSAEQKARARAYLKGAG